MSGDRESDNSYSEKSSNVDTQIVKIGSLLANKGRNAEEVLYC